MLSIPLAIRGAVLGGAMGIALGLNPSPATGQADARQAIQQLTGREVSQQQILDRLRGSGLTREQARQRLTAAGFDANLVDPYFDRLEGNRNTLPDASRGFLAALAEIGLAAPGLPTMDTLPRADTLEAIEREEVPDSVQVFGLQVFQRATDQFEPVAAGPVDADYRLGPGDQVILILTGDVELAYSLDVTREGFLVIPDVGQVSVNGATLEGLRDRLFDRLGRVYSGVRRSPDASTRFDVSLGRLRTNQVFVIGDVARPGAYQVSAVGTVLNALYRAGGPTEDGSFRTVSVQRAGRVVAEVDLYDYLLQGNAASDVRLEQGDVVFVPPVGAQVTLRGEVRRPAIYEVRAGESLASVVRFAGGFLPGAYVQRVQVDRILPPADRTPGRDRVLLDADVQALQAGAGPSFPVAAGDEVTVFGVQERTRGRVTLAGAVWRPGAYEFNPGMTLADLIARADGLLPSAYLNRATVRRLIPETGGTRLLQASLGPGGSAERLALEDLDEITVFDVDSLSVPKSVDILGEVKNPGRYELDEHTTVEDLILRAGGYTAAADPNEAWVARVRRHTDRSDTLSIRYRLRLTDGIPVPMPEDAYAPAGGLPLVDADADEFALRDGDQVVIRRLAGWVEPGFVRVRGQVLYPGSYPLESRYERISSVVGRAGGVTPQAYLPGGQLIRDSVLVAVDFRAALAEPGGEADVLLLPGDALEIPEMDPTVTVSGDVVFPIRVLYEPGQGVDEYLSAAGGSAGNADLDRLSVQYASGRRAVARKFLFFRRYPRVEPGSEIFVPAKVESQGLSWGQVFERTLGVTTSVLTVLVLANQLQK